MLIQNGLETTLHRLLLHPFSRLFIILLAYGAAVGLARLGVFSPRHFRLRKKGMDLLLEGKPVEAEKRYRAALDLGAKVPASDRVRLLVCLGDALMDQQRYEEANQYLTQALQLGDPTGSGQGSMCDLLLYRRQAPEKAIGLADEAMQLWTRTQASQAFGDRWTAVSKQLYEAKSWARKTRALVMLDRQTEARQAMERALRIMEESKSELQQAMPTTSLTGRLILGGRLRRQKELAISAIHWHIGLALLGMRDSFRAAEHFRMTRKTDRRGKYRNLAQEQLTKLGYIDTLTTTLA